MPNITENDLRLWLSQRGISNRVCTPDYKVDLSECGDVIIIPLSQFTATDVQQQKT